MGARVVVCLFTVLHAGEAAEVTDHLVEQIIRLDVNAPWKRRRSLSLKSYKVWFLWYSCSLSLLYNRSQQREIRVGSCWNWSVKLRKGGAGMNVVNQTEREGVFGESLSYDPSALSGASAITAVIKGTVVAWPEESGLLRIWILSLTTRGRSDPISGIITAHYHI